MSLDIHKDFKHQHLKKLFLNKLTKWQVSCGNSADFPFKNYPELKGVYVPLCPLYTTLIIWNYILFKIFLKEWVCLVDKCELVFGN